METRVTDPHPWDGLSEDRVHIWNTLGYRRADAPEGCAAVEWDATAEYSFPDGDRRIIHGGMVATLLDTAMGHVCVSRLGWGETFLTADLHVEFYRASTPGMLRAEAEVVHQSRRAVFCAASLYDPEGKLLASARCTQIVRSSK
jgi:uncharacterized protein (TIGR00369 family)